MPVNTWNAGVRILYRFSDLWYARGATWGDVPALEANLSKDVEELARAKLILAVTAPQTHPSIAGRFSELGFTCIDFNNPNTNNELKLWYRAGKNQKPVNVRLAASSLMRRYWFPDCCGIDRIKLPAVIPPEITKEIIAEKFRRFRGRFVITLLSNEDQKPKLTEIGFAPLITIPAVEVWAYTSPRRSEYAQPH